VKVGDLILCKEPGSHEHPGHVGTVVDFPVANHPKQHQKVKVLVSGEITEWIMQYCEVINENR